MRFLAVWLLLCLLLGTPFVSSNVAELAPVEILCLQKDGAEILAVCDGGIAARGATAEQAVQALHNAAPGRLFLGTVDHLVVTGLRPDASGLMGLGLRPAVGVYEAPEKAEDPGALAKYLRVHSGGVTLGMLEEDGSLSLPRLERGASGLILEG